MTALKKRLRIALNKPLPDHERLGDPDQFCPWRDVIQGISGDYASLSDELMIATLKAVRDRSTLDLIKDSGFIVEFMLYVLAGHGLIEYGTSPRGGWPDPDVEDMWQELIDKWEAWAVIAWQE